jgi:D-amino peptidase
VKIYISADIEGVAGVVVPPQTVPGNAEYERARRLMTAEVNAAIAGAFDGGATGVLVNDSHGPMTNLLPDELDPRAELILGKPKSMNMAAGLDGSFGGMFMLGYHAGAGRHGVLAHTTSGFAFAAIRLNGMPAAEATLYGAYAGELGVPVRLLSGDDVLAAECGPLFPGARVAVVKQALGNRAARAVSPARAREMLRAEAAAAMAAPVPPFTVAAPYRVAFDMNSPALADLAATVPVARRTGPVTVEFDAGTMAEVLGWLNTLSALSAFLRA